MPDSLFSSVDFDAARFANDISKPPPRKTYVIVFTARSGSSWLTDVLARTKCFGNPGEYFNPQFVPTIAHKLNANSAESLVEVVKRRFCHGGVFGVEVTFGHIGAVFGGQDRFLSHFPPMATHWFLLIRENIVEQAVSLYKMVTTNISHSIQLGAGDIETADQRFDYDAAQIRRWLLHLLTHEHQSIQMFHTFGLTPVRLSYEMMMRVGPQGVIETFATALDEPMPSVANLIGRHTKVGTAKNLDYAERFAAEHADLIADVSDMRVKGSLGDLQGAAAAFRRARAFSR